MTDLFNYEREDDSVALPARQIYTVSELNAETKDVIEGSFPLIWVEGEISNLARPASGHLYFSLKDESAQVRCAMFRMRNRLINFAPKNGAQVLIRAQVGFYEARGEFQLIAEHMEEAGTGALRRKFEELKRKLADEGLFDNQRKQDMPDIPQRVGVITSPTGAAIRDILSVLQRRYPALPVLIYPVAVQGDTAAIQIAQMIDKANQRKECDVLILARGGGSLEDLWSFNEEVVARAIDQSQIPLVCAVGHETDFSIADFVADVRAATPSAAAELISPNRAEWLELVRNFKTRLTSHIQQKISLQAQQLHWLQKRLIHPSQSIQTQSQRIDELEQRLIRSQKQALRLQQARLLTTRARLMQSSPMQKLNALELRRAALAKRLSFAIQQGHERQKRRLDSVVRALDTVSPLATLSRGYSILQTSNNNIIRSSSDINIGDSIKAKLAKGELVCMVEKINHNNK